MRSRISIPAEDQDITALRRGVVAKLIYAVGRDPIVATDRDWFVATALAVRDHVIERWMASTRANYTSQCKRVYYLSLEFLIGRLLFDSLNNLGLAARMRLALAELGVDFDRLRELEPDAALGNGGLGRLAACFMESMATLSIASHGYGIRYDHGLFRQVIKDGWQTGVSGELAGVRQSLGSGTARRARAPSASAARWRHAPPTDGATRCIWRPGETVARRRLRHARRRLARPLCQHVAAVVSLGGGSACVSIHSTTATMSARWRDARGRMRYRRCYIRATKTPPGRNCACVRSISSPLRRCRTWSTAICDQHGDIRTLADKAAIQLNDTHPAIAVAELMRLLVDVHEVPWEDAWRITTDTTSYTNHTLLPEALESWPVALIERLLPRHMQIIHQINRAHLDGLRNSGRSDIPPLEAVSLIDDAGGRRVRMSTLAFLGSHKVNGVSALHTELMRQDRVSRPAHALSRIGSSTRRTASRSAAGCSRRIPV